MPIMFAAFEVAGAELAATLTADAAAAAAAEAAAIEAAKVAAAEAAAQEAARQAATQQAAQTAVNSGITSVPDPSQLAAKGSFNPSTGQFINTTLPPDPVFQNIGGQGVTTPQTFPVNDGGITSVPQMSYDSFGNPALQGSPAATMADPTGLAELQQAANAAPPPSALEGGFTKAMEWADKNPFKASAIAYTGANALGLLNPSAATFNQEKYDGPLSKYKLSPNFQAGSANPANFQYQPRYAAGGGIMGAGSYDIPVGYDEGGPVLSLPPRVTRSSDAFRVPGAAYDPAQVASADAYNDILRNRVYADNRSGRADDPMYGVADARQLETTANSTVRGFDPTLAKRELLKRSNEGEFAAPGYGDLGQFAGSFGNSMGGGGGSAKPGFDEQGNATMAFAKGGSLSDSIESYQKMLAGKPQAAPSRPADVGIYYDQDPDTRYQDALTAAQIRQSKVNQRAYVSPPAAKRPTPMGQLQMASVKPRKQSDDVEAASGGIMHSSLGGYAAGGNPRLLKGPGDGMSDNIPATINGRQPARLADGEFVIPADVVSHLGNGSTEAGAKHLHAMMNKVRKARTGNPKQGKEINAKKYMPK
jgi:hypothetical protein